MENDDFLKSLHDLLCGQENIDLMEIANQSPLYMMIRLLAFDPENKTYQACFYMETDKIIERLSKKMNIMEAIFLNKIFYKIDADMLEKTGIKGMLNQSVIETGMMIDALHYILNSIIEKKKKENDERQ